MIETHKSVALVAFPDSASGPHASVFPAPDIATANICLSELDVGHLDAIELNGRWFVPAVDRLAESLNHTWERRRGHDHNPPPPFFT